MAWNKLGTTTLSSTADVIDSGACTAVNFIFGMSHVFANGGDKAPNLRFYQTGGTAYTTRHSDNGGEILVKQVNLILKESAQQMMMIS